jgi:hypothetical protein
MICLQCGRNITPQARFCPQCGASLPLPSPEAESSPALNPTPPQAAVPSASPANAPSPLAAPALAAHLEPVRPVVINTKNNASPRPAHASADLLQILADLLVIVAFFLPWIGAESGTSPLNLLLNGKIVWWMWLIPIAAAFGSFVDLWVTLARVLTGRPAPTWRKWNYFTSGLFLAIVAVGWWMAVVYLPVFPTPQGYVRLAYLLLAGTFVGVGIGLVLLFAAAVVQIVAGTIAYAMPSRR